jgi:hypothetical protein
MLLDGHPAVTTLGNGIEHPPMARLGNHVDALDPERFTGPEYRADIVVFVQVLENRCDRDGPSRQNIPEPFDPVGEKIRFKKFEISHKIN